MRVPKFLVAAIVAAASLACSSSAHAQLGDFPIGRDVDAAAVRRMGNSVQHTGTIETGDESAALFSAEMAALPPDDNAKWFVTVVTQRGCGPCETLLRGWSKDPYLSALANPDDKSTSWAHFNSYDLNDRRQAWRFVNLKITATPTILVQPPLVGRGDHKTLVYQGVYQGNSEKTVGEIAASIRLYLRSITPNVAPVQTPIRAGMFDNMLKEDVIPAAGFGEQLTESLPWQFRLRPRPQPSTVPWAPTPGPVPYIDPTIPTVLPPRNDVDGLQFPPAVVLTPPVPAATPSGTAPKPAAPTAEKPNDETPEAIIVTDGDEDQTSNADGRLQTAVEALKGRLGMPRIKTRMLDWREAKEKFPDLSRDELPAVMVTGNGRIVEKISSRLLPVVQKAVSGITIFDLPLSALFGLVMTGSVVPIVGAIAVWGLRKFRAKRVADGTAILDDATFSKVVTVVQGAVAAAAVAKAAAPAAAPPTNP